MFGELILNCDLDDDTTINVLRMLDDGVIKEIIDRGVVEVPRTFMPSATQFAVADDGRFFCLAYSAGMYHILLRRKWFGGVREKRLDVLTKDCHWLSVRGYGCMLTRYKNLWAIARRPLGSNAGDILSLNSTPIFFTDPKWAKELAKACHPCPRKEAKGLCWVPSAAEERGSQ